MAVGVGGDIKEILNIDVIKKKIIKDGEIFNRNNGQIAIL